MAEYYVSVSCSWITPIKAKSIEEAIEKADNLYRLGKGHIPRQYIEVCNAECDFSQVED